MDGMQRLDDSSSCVQGGQHRIMERFRLLVNRALCIGHGKAPEILLAPTAVAALGSIGLQDAGNRCKTFRALQGSRGGREDVSRTKGRGIDEGKGGV